MYQIISGLGVGVLCCISLRLGNYLQVGARWGLWLHIYTALKRELVARRIIGRKFCGGNLSKSEGHHVDAR